MAALMRIQHGPGVLEYRVLSKHRLSSPKLASIVSTLVILLTLVRVNTKQALVGESQSTPFLTWLLAGLALLWIHTPHVLHESLWTFQNFGLQLETRRVWFGVVISTSSEFIPAASIKDIIINEVLSRWQFKHYLAVLRCGPPDSEYPTLSVAFQNILPPVTLLSEIYRYLHPLPGEVWSLQH